MTIHQALSLSRELLNRSSTPQLDSELLLCHVLGCEKTELITQSERELTTEQLELFKKCVQERAAGKPVEHITHRKEFFGREFYIDERALIPRPESEEMVEVALEFLRARPELKTTIDLGSGSGAIGMSIALELPERQVIGLEISEKALEVAKINQQKHSCPNLTLIQSDLLDQLPPTSSSMPLCIIANLPYIGTQTHHFVSDEADRYEPHIALYGGQDGLELYRRTWRQIKEKNLNLAALFMEIGFSQAEQMEKEAKAAFPNHQFELKTDLAGLPRMAILLQRL
ncbi:MAG: peptide chain release factor N(5)-glutamine methyltransferase [bacterium]|nr:peptide chain release factor N(5)-glutamine methyltransferase [bacterium]